MSFLELLRDTIGFLAVHTASFVTLGASAWIFGETALSLLPPQKLDPAARFSGPGQWALAGALGWGLIAQSMFLLGVLGLFHRGIVLGLLVLGHLACLRTWRSVLKERRFPGMSPAGYLVTLPLFALTLYPPTGFDATVYHLPYARAFVEAGRLEFLADLRFPVFPQAGEMGFVLGFFLSGEVVARMTQLLATLLTAGPLLDWGRLYGSRSGTWAAALWLGNPLIVWLGTSAYIDATLALFVTASFYSWERWERDGERRRLWLAGAFAGMAVATKYLGLFFLAALGIMTAMRSLKRRDAGPLVTLSAVAFLALAPWYLRIVYHTGNPIFPFYAPIFGSSEWATLHDQALPAAGPEDGAPALWSVDSSQGARIVEGLAFLVKVPWTAIFDRGVFHWQAPLSPYYLLLIPLCGPIALLEGRRRRLVTLAMGYGLFWLTTVRDLRFLIAVLPALNVALAATLDGWVPRLERRWRRLPNLAPPLVTALLLVPGPLYAVYKLVEYGWPPIDAAQRTAYLSRQVAGFEAVAAMNRAEGRDYTVYALYGENLRYYAGGRFLGDWFGPARYSRIEAVLTDSRALAGEIESLGACFFLLRHPRARELLPADPNFDRHFQQIAAGDGFMLYRLPAVDCSRDTEPLGIDGGYR